MLENSKYWHKLIISFTKYNIFYHTLLWKTSKILFSSSRYVFFCIPNPFVTHINVRFNKMEGQVKETESFRILKGHQKCFRLLRIIKVISYTCFTRTQKTLLFISHIQLDLNMDILMNNHFISLYKCQQITYI